MTSSPAPAIKPIQAPAGAAASSAATALLVLAWLALWLAVVAACYLLLIQRSITLEINMTLGEPARFFFGLCWWPWFGDYWWVVVLSILILTPVVALVSYWIRHRYNSRLASWIWGILLIVPPVVLLVVDTGGLISANASILHALRTYGDEPANYLEPDGQRLRSPLKLREVRQAAGVSPDGKIVVIEPAGDWRVIPGLSELNRPPLRQGKLATGQLKLLAEHLAREKFQYWSGLEKELVTVVDPLANRDSLVVEFGDRHLTLDGVRRDRLQEVQGLQLWETDSQARIASLVLVIEDLVTPRNHNLTPAA